MRYRAANGTPIANKGEKSLSGYSSTGSPIGITFQMADVTKPLGSVRAMVDAGNRVVFDKGNSYIQHKGTGMTTKIEERGGAYVFDMWVPRTSGNRQVNQVSTGRYDALKEEGNDAEAGFVRQDAFY